MFIGLVIGFVAGIGVAVMVAVIATNRLDEAEAKLRDQRNLNTELIKECDRLSQANYRLMGNPGGFPESLAQKAGR